MILLSSLVGASCALSNWGSHDKFYDWIEYERPYVHAAVKYPDNDPICRAKTTVVNDEIYLAGIVKDHKCIFGWNKKEETSNFDLLISNCADGSELSWFEERDLESVGDEVRVEVNTAGFSIGVCVYNGKNGWKRGKGCMWKTPEAGAQENNYETHHKMLTIIGCKLPPLSFYDRAQFMKENEEDFLRYDFLPTDDAVFIGKNYSPKYHTRHIKKEDSHVQWSTGLLKVPKWHDIEANFNLLSYGKEGSDWETNFVWYKESKTPEIQESVKYEVVKIVSLEREINFDVTSPQKISLFGKYESEFVALEVKQTLRHDGTRKQLQYPKVSNFQMFPKAKECFPLGPSPSAKVICDDEQHCRTVCRRRFTMKGSLKKLRCENGFWISDNYQPLNELYMYFMLNYLCMPKDVPVQELVRKYKETHDNLIEPEDPFE